jgi:hypothetical protein
MTEEIKRTKEEIRKKIDEMIPKDFERFIRELPTTLLPIINNPVAELQDALHFDKLPKEENDVYKWLVKSNKPYALD